MVERLLQRPASDWQRAWIKQSKGGRRRIRFLDDRVRLRNYEGELRQLCVMGLGRASPTLFISNDEETTAREIVMDYAGRNGIEDGLGTCVNFFHLDCLSSEVRLNVDLDVTLSVIAQGCYRWLASQLRGFDSSQPKRLFRRIVETPGTVEFSDRGIEVSFDRRAYNPVIAAQTTSAAPSRIPWLSNRPLHFSFP